MVEKLDEAIKMKDKLYENLKKLYPNQIKTIAKKYPEFPEIDKIESFKDLKNILIEVENSLKMQGSELKEEIVKIINKSGEIENKVLVNLLSSSGYNKEEIYKILDNMEVSGIIKKRGKDWAEVVWSLK